MNFIDMLRRLKTEYVVNGFDWSCRPHPNPEVPAILVMAFDNKRQSLQFLVGTEISDEDLEFLCETAMSSMLEDQFTGVVNLMAVLGIDPHAYLAEYLTAMKLRQTTQRVSTSNEH